MRFTKLEFGYTSCYVMRKHDHWQGSTKHRRIESKHHRRNSGSNSGLTGKEFPKYGAPHSILPGRKWWPLPAHVMMSHFLHKEVSPLQISLQYPH